MKVYLVATLFALVLLTAVYTEAKPLEALVDKMAADVRAHPNHVVLREKRGTSSESDQDSESSQSIESSISDDSADPESSESSNSDDSADSQSSESSNIDDSVDPPPIFVPL